MYIVRNTRKKASGTYIYTFLAKSYWDKETKKPKRKILANLSSLPKRTITTIGASLKKGKDIFLLENLVVEKSIDYGYFFIILKIIKKLKIDQAIRTVLKEEDKTNIAILMIIGKIITRGSKLGIVNWIKRNDILAEKLCIDITKLTEKDLYSVQFDLNNLQEKIENKYFLYNKKRINTVYLYDITSFYFEGKKNELSMYGYNRDKKKGKQIALAGLITDSNGFPLKIKVFKGNIKDEKTVQEILITLKKEFGTKEIIFVGDRGMRIKYNLENMEEKDKQDIKYITGLTVNEIRELEKKKVIQMSLFDKTLKEIEADGKRYILCLNPNLAQEKLNTRATFKLKFETELVCIQKAYKRETDRCKTNTQKIKEDSKKKGKLKVRLRNKELKIWNYKIMKAQEKYKMKNVFMVVINRQQFKIEYNAIAYEELGRFDGKYVFETTVEKDKLNTEEVRNMYKKLQNVEHSFRDMKTGRLNLRPIFHTKEQTTRSHVFIGMFAYAVINEIENKTYAWLKQLKKTNNKLSINDVIEELKMIKLSILSFGEKNTHREIRVTKLNDNQKKILELLEINRGYLT